MSPDLEPEEIRFDDLTSLTDWTPTEHGVEVTVRNLALWLLSLMESDSDVAQMRVRLGPGRAPLTSLQREAVAGEGDDAYALVLR
jgi:hypothetical protein